MVNILEKTGDDLNKLAEAAKSTDVKKESDNIIAKVEKLVDATGDGAKKLLHEIKDDVTKLKEKV